MNTVNLENNNETLGQAFIRFAVSAGVLRFGEFKTKAGRISPYFFNAGLFNDGIKLTQLSQFYAKALLSSSLTFDQILGPAYKGIPLACALAIELAKAGKNIPFSYNRKESKTHGEGGNIIGAALCGRILIVDDVISAGTAVREAIECITSHQAQAHALIVALDRQEKATAIDEKGQIQDLPYSAVQYVEQHLGLAVCAIAKLDDLLSYLKQQENPELQAYLPKVQAYRDRYGVD